ncbi:MAG: hypothetical protein K1X50_15820 [Candidatus Promineofilum sp.]|jgi:hypothetical protein|nr:hypothetical protein [Promineifilum sp.]MCW5862871.1 restriction endonuclease [Anaerolineae bacterium]
MVERTRYQRTPEELELLASKFWPYELSALEADLSIIPILLQTQDQFLSIISIETPDLESLFTIVESSTLSSNLFLKHLAILADFGGEMLQRVRKEFARLFPLGELTYQWRGEQHTYSFKALPKATLNNKSLGIDGKQLLVSRPLSDLQKDAAAILLFGSFVGDQDQPAHSALSRCEIGEYLGKPDDLATFVKQRYIWVSRITAGAKVNNLGQLAQRFVSEYLKESLTETGIAIQTSGRLPNVTHTDDDTGRLTSFDLVATNSKKFVAIEVCFQVTTNSVIERKAGQARARYMQVANAGHKIAYVIDGSGNFQRETALRVICAHSHCTVAFSRAELDVLRQFLVEELVEARP